MREEVEAEVRESGRLCAGNTRECELRMAGKTKGERDEEMAGEGKGGFAKVNKGSTKSLLCCLETDCGCVYRVV